MLVAVTVAQGSESSPSIAPAPVETTEPAPGEPLDPIVDQGPAVATLLPVTRVRAIVRAGQVFITWPERTDIAGETYRVFRSARRISPRNLKRAKLLGTVGESSSRVWSERRQSNKGWTWRNLSRAVIPRRGELDPTTGLFVWTPDAGEVAAARGSAHYAVVVRKGRLRTAPTDSGPVRERVAHPRPVEAFSIGRRAHVFLQYMDLHDWNPTYDAPNAVNDHLGFDRSDPAVRHALSVAYAYVVAEPDPRTCDGGVVPDSLPLVVQVHGFGRERDPPDHGYARWCAIELRPTDPALTRWFGFALDHDYRRDPTVDADDRIANFTEMRVLRMIADTFADPDLGPRLDRERVYLWGGSMGGTGVINLALRYPQVFAAAYAWSPIPDYASQNVGRRRQGVPSWGPVARNLPVTFLGPADLLGPLRPWEGIGVWTWENGTWGADALRGLDSAPIGFVHGTLDRISSIVTQATPLYRAMDRGRRTSATSIRVGGHPYVEGFMGLPATLRAQGGVPFWGLRAVRSETIPGFSNDSRYPDLPPDGPAEINTQLEWSASWDSWDGPPVDEPGRWAMSFRTIDDVDHVVDITPRRLQRFAVDPARTHRWTLVDLATETVLDQGTVSPDQQGLLNVRITITPTGTRLTIESSEPGPARNRNKHHKRPKRG